MTKEEFLEAKQRLEDLFGENKFSEGAVLCRQLLGCMESVSGLENVTDVVKELVNMNAVVVIETKSMNEAVKAKDLLKRYGDDTYSHFLRARLSWLMEDNFQAMTIMEECCHVHVSDDDLIISEDSPLLKMTGNMQQLIFNFFAHIYKFFSMPIVAMKCSYIACSVAEDLPAKWQEYSNYLFNAHYLFMTKEEYFLAHKGFNALFKNWEQLTHDRVTHRRHKKIRLGYISSDFRQHVCLLFIWVMVTKYNRDKFEVYVFSKSSIEDKYSECIKSNVDQWFNIASLYYPKAAKFIYDHEVDILVDLAGHSSGNALPVLAYKPAPVQVCGIGYFATTGLKAVDYFLTDKYLVNKDTKKYFVEKLLIMPHSHFCYTPLNDMPQACTGAPCKRNGYITFGSFNGLTKVNDEVLLTWINILRQVPGSKIILKGNMLGCPEGKELMRQKLLAMGLVEEQFDLRPFTLPYLEEYNEIDIALDTFPYPGGGTTCDALYMGVPVVTLGDGSHGGNFGISLLKNIGLDECCTYSRQEYIERAVLLASDYELLDVMHRGLRNMMDNSPILNSALYMKNLEDGYEKIWQRYVSIND